MARVNISIPDEILRRAKDAGLNISKLARNAILEELDSAAKIAAFDKYIAELESELGSPTEDQLADAKAWADGVFGTTEKGRKTA